MTAQTLNRQQAHSFALVALFAAFMGVLGLVPKIDLPFNVPITIQSLGVMLAGCLLGARRGFLAIALFLLAVAAGAPLLSGGRGGIAPFTAPSAGYLVGYALAAGMTGLIMSRLRADSPARAAKSAFIASVLGGIVFLHALGIVGLMAIAGMPLDKAVMIDLAFIPGDLIKAVLCTVIVHTIARAMPDWEMGREMQPQTLARERGH